VNSNDLKRRIAIWKYDRSENTGGTPIERFLFYKYTYGLIKVITGGLQIDQTAPGTIAETTFEIIIRYDPKIDYNCKIVYGNYSYKIIYIEEIERKAFLKLRCFVFNEVHPENSWQK
jgi:SPP1 family predicted phage head-tail adaptor